MKFLLDTNALSETRRPGPDPSYVRWLRSQDPSGFATSAIVYGELRRGVLKLDPGAKRAGLEAWLMELTARFGTRILPVDLKVAVVWAEIADAHRRLGRAVLIADELIAATALAHGLTLVTRNVRDFEASGCAIVCPWT